MVMNFQAISALARTRVMERKDDFIKDFASSASGDLAPLFNILNPVLGMVGGWFFKGCEFPPLPPSHPVSLPPTLSLTRPLSLSPSNSLSLPPTLSMAVPCFFAIFLLVLLVSPNILC